jgi:aryl-alcohol dehydrogenase-like predicted oxidoreductase
VIAQKPWFVPIPGTRKLNRLKENNDAANIEFAEEELTTLNEELAKIVIAGSRTGRIKERLLKLRS